MKLGKHTIFTHRYPRTGLFEVGGKMGSNLPEEGAFIVIISPVNIGKKIRL
jgi:hypothetical protein